MDPIYNLGVATYRNAVKIAAVRNPKAKLMLRGQRRCFRTLQRKLDPAGGYIWIHASSLGEFEQGRPLIEKIKREQPDARILLSFFSPSGYEVRKDYPGADIVTYLPLDTIANARRFLRAIRPVMAFFIKYEFWYNYLHILKHRHVPVYSVSSIFRPGQVFFRWYGSEYGRVLRCFTHFFVQNQVSKDLLAKLKITDVSIVGDTRFDRVLQIKQQAKVLPVVEQFKSSGKVFVAGSSWLPDEEIFIPYFLKEKPDWKLIIAPHVIDEAHLQQIEKLLEGRRVVRYTEMMKCQSPATNPQSPLTETPSEADVLIIDCFGLLSSIYRYADIAYVGGGFGVGIHNLPEAAVWGVPVFFGPNNQRFQEAQDLKECGGGVEIADYGDFRSKMEVFAGDPSKCQEVGRRAANYIKEKSGATEKVLSALGL